MFKKLQHDPRFYFCLVLFILSVSLFVWFAVDFLQACRIAKIKTLEQNSRSSQTSADFVLLSPEPLPEATIAANNIPHHNDYLDYHGFYFQNYLFLPASNEKGEFIVRVPLTCSTHCTLSRPYSFSPDYFTPGICGSSFFFANLHANLPEQPESVDIPYQSNLSFDPETQIIVDTATNGDQIIGDIIINVNEENNLHNLHGDMQYFDLTDQDLYFRSSPVTYLHTALGPIQTIPLNSDNVITWTKLLVGNLSLEKSINILSICDNQYICQLYLHYPDDNHLQALPAHQNYIGILPGQAIIVYEPNNHQAKLITIDALNETIASEQIIASNIYDIPGYDQETKKLYYLTNSFEIYSYNLITKEQQRIVDAAVYFSNQPTNNNDINDDSTKSTWWLEHYIEDDQHNDNYRHITTTEHIDGICFHHTHKQYMDENYNGTFYNFQTDKFEAESPLCPY